MNIRPLAASDRARILEILRGTTRFTDREIGWAMELVDLVVDEQGRGEYEAWVIGEAGAPAEGYVLVGPTPMSEGVWDLYWIAVAPELQGGGRGRAMLAFVESELVRRGARLLLIETSSKRSYEPTRRFYEREGYREISRIKDFYRNEDDKVVFSKTLEHP